MVNGFQDSDFNFALISDALMCTLNNTNESGRMSSKHPVCKTRMASAGEKDRNLNVEVTWRESSKVSDAPAAEKSGRSAFLLQNATLMDMLDIDELMVDDATHVGHSFAPQQSRTPMGACRRRPTRRLLQIAEAGNTSAFEDLLDAAVSAFGLPSTGRPDRGELISSDDWLDFETIPSGLETFYRQRW